MDNNEITLELTTLKKLESRDFMLKNWRDDRDH
jgi:hypothetical protein